MSDIHASLNAAARTNGFNPSSVLAMLADGISGAEVSVFAKILSQNETKSDAPAKLGGTASPVSIAAMSMPGNISWHGLVAQLRHFVEQQARQPRFRSNDGSSNGQSSSNPSNNVKGSCSIPKDAPKNDAVSSVSADDTAKLQGVVVSASADTAITTSASGDNDTLSIDDLQKLVGLLQQLMQWLAQQKPVGVATGAQVAGADEMASSDDETTTTASDDTANSDDDEATVATSDEATADIAAALQNLLLMLQEFEKKIVAANAPVAAADTTDAGVTGKTGAAVSSSDIKDGLMKLVAALQEFRMLPGKTDKAGASGSDAAAAINVKTDVDTGIIDGDTTDAAVATPAADVIANTAIATATDTAISASDMLSFPGFAPSASSAPVTNTIVAATAPGTADKLLAATVANVNADAQKKDADNGQRFFDGSKEAGAAKPTAKTATEETIEAAVVGDNAAFAPRGDVQVKAAADAVKAITTDIGEISLKTGLSATSSAAPAHIATLPEGLAASNPYGFAGQLSVARAAVTATSFNSVVDQVILQLNRSAKSGQSDINLQLHPAELGRINVKLNLAADGSVQGTVVADNPATLDALLKDVRSLERALQDAGLRADPGSLQFSLGGQQGSGFGQNAKDASGNEANTPQPGDENTDAAAALAQETYYITPGRVNLRV